MANCKIFSNEEELRSIKGAVSVITVEPGPISAIPEAVIIDKYVDGEKVEGAEQYFETSNVSSDILDAELESDVYVSAEAEGVYDTMIELAELFKKSNGNYDVYSELLDEMIENDEFYAD